MLGRMPWAVLVAGSLAAAVFAYACGIGTSGTCEDNGTCAVSGDGAPADQSTGADSASAPDASEGGGDAGVEADAPVGDAPVEAQGDAPACDPTQDPKDAPCLVSNGQGVFVSTNGSDQGDGTMTSPVRTITAGIAKATQVGLSRVYVCQGSYAEQVVIDAQHDGMGVYGGYDCVNGWTWSGGTTTVTGPSALYALRVSSTTRAVVVEDMSFTVPDAVGQDGTGSGNSSVAGFVSDETAGVSLLRVQLTAGSGAPGAAGGAPATNWFSSDAGDLQGNPASGNAGGAAKDCPCKGWGDTQGGAGGNAGVPTAADGGAGTAVPPATAQGVQNGAGGQGRTLVSVCTAGDPGADGNSVADAGAGARVAGVISETGWVPAAGGNGHAGNPGQGGGGAGGGPAAGIGTNGGGGGGCGGCGGAGGLGGGGGGGSIALLVFHATVHVSGGTLQASDGKNGGPGSMGESGAAGGGGGNVGACGGGPGGNGAGGQGGGGGAGGVSVGVLLDMSSQVAVDSATTFHLGQFGGGGGPGDGGSGGANGISTAPAGSAGTKGADGIAIRMLAL